MQLVLMADRNLCGGFHLCRRLFLLRGQVNAALFADFLVVALDVVNQLTGSLVDGLQTGPQLLQLLVLRPGSDVAKTVLAGLDAEILANRMVIPCSPFFTWRSNWFFHF